MSNTKERHCLVINKTTGTAIKKAEKDYKEIKETMEQMKFNVQKPNFDESWRDKLKCKFKLLTLTGFIQLTYRK